MQMALLPTITPLQESNWIKFPQMVLISY